MSPTIRGNRVSSTRIPTVTPYWLKPPHTRPVVMAPSLYSNSGRAVTPRPQQQHQQRVELLAVIGLASHVLANELGHHLGVHESRAAQHALLAHLVDQRP